MICQLSDCYGLDWRINTEMICSISELPKDCKEYDLGARYEVRLNGGSQVFIDENTSLKVAMA